MIRPAVAGDTAALVSVIDAVGLFPGKLLEGMLAEHWVYAGDPAEEPVWLVDTEQGAICAVAYYALERMTAGTWNLYLIAVHPRWQRRGRGQALVARVEADLTARGQRLLLVETSSLPEFDGARRFYARSGFDQVARIGDFYRDGEDKLVFRKALSVSPAPPPGA